MVVRCARLLVEKSFDACDWRRCPPALSRLGLATLLIGRGRAWGEWRAAAPGRSFLVANTGLKIETYRNS